MNGRSNTALCDGGLVGGVHICFQPMQQRRERVREREREMSVDLLS